MLKIHILSIKSIYNLKVYFSHINKLTTFNTSQLYENDNNIRDGETYNCRIEKENGGRGP